MKKMNTLLATTSGGQAHFKAAVRNYAAFFKGNQGAFLGERGTYEAMPDTVDEDSRRRNISVQTTVDEKLQWFKDANREFLNELFTVELTNASGTAVAELSVDGDSWGPLSTLELLRLKGLLEDNNFITMMSQIPVRSDAEQWTTTSEEQYSGRKGIFEGPLQLGQSRTTVKESYILPDPNVSKLKDGVEYKPQIGQKHTVEVLGDYTHQRYSGEWSQRQRAELMQKRNVLYKAVIEALKVANDVEVKVESKLGSTLLDYLF